jgi:hypothetical protein
MAGLIEGKVRWWSVEVRRPATRSATGVQPRVLLAREGAEVVVADRDLARAEDTAACIRDDGGGASAVRRGSPDGPPWAFAPAGPRVSARAGSTTTP